MNRIIVIVLVCLLIGCAPQASAPAAPTLVLTPAPVTPSAIATLSSPTVPTTKESEQTVAKGPPFDFSTEAGIDDAHEVVLGYRNDDRDYRCFKQVEALDIALFGDYVYDAGCGFRIVVLAENEFGEIDEMQGSVLRHNGWDELAKREELAFLWSSTALFGSAMQEPSELFMRRDVPFEPPAAMLQEDGSVAVRFWTAHDQGEAWAVGFRLNAIAISADANTKTNSLERLFVVHMSEEADNLAHLGGTWRAESGERYTFANYEYSFDNGAGTVLHGAISEFERFGETETAMSLDREDNRTSWNRIFIESADDILIIDGVEFVRQTD